MCLCVGLDGDFFYLIQSYAHRNGLRCEASDWGSGLKDRIRLSHPAAILMELDRAEQEYLWSFLQEVRSDRELHEIPVVLFSWLNLEETALENGVDVYARKPIMYADFTNALISIGICPQSNDLDFVDDQRR
jgi:CheY-like chemotaxis protein